MIWFTVACSIAGGGQPASSLGSQRVDSAFWEAWGDGKAELSSYALTEPRYGEARAGTAVWVFVTEDFTEAQRVKSDGGHTDEFHVLKHNDVRHFQTGLYDYELLTSTFTRLDGRDPIGRPTKVSTSVQEWCGHAYAQAILRANELALTSHSYFDGEGDEQRSLPVPADGVLLDALPTLARGLAGEWPLAGQTVQVHLLDTFVRQRFAHEGPRWIGGTVERAAEVAEVTVPAGTFPARAVIAQAGPDRWTWEVEVAPPHRILRWTGPQGERGELIATIRAPYWALHAESDEAHLAELGLPVPR